MPSWWSSFIRVQNEIIVSHQNFSPQIHHFFYHHAKISSVDLLCEKLQAFRSHPTLELKRFQIRITIAFLQEVSVSVY